MTEALAALEAIARHEDPATLAHVATLLGILAQHPSLLPRLQDMYRHLAGWPRPRGRRQ